MDSDRKLPPSSIDAIWTFVIFVPVAVTETERTP
jgi:hypothetical protein